MEHDIRAALIAWLASGPASLDTLNAIEEEVPQRSGPPWLAIAASASADWGTKDRMGREVRVALELHTRGQDVAGDAALVRAIDRRVEDLPRQHDHFHIVTIQFLRARAERRPAGRRAMLLEYRFRSLANQPE